MGNGWNGVVVISGVADPVDLWSSFVSLLLPDIRSLLCGCFEQFDVTGDP